MKKKAFLILILIFVFGIDFYFVLFSQPYYQRNIKQKNSIEVNDDVSFEEMDEINNKKYELHELSEDLNDYICGAELGCFKIILNTFSKDIELKANPANYFEGRMHPNMFYLFAKNYCEQNDKYMQIKDISGLTIKSLQQICENGWLVQVWYCKDADLNIDPQFRWQNANVGIIYKIEDDTFYILDAIDGFQEFSRKDFIDMWQYCGNYAFLYR